MAAPLPSRLDANQVLQGSFDEATGTLRTTAEATVINADIDVALDATEDNVATWTNDANGNPISSDYGTSVEALRTAAQIGNSTGAADFDLGPITPQTLRTAANNLGIDPNGDITENRESGKVDSNSTTTPLLAGGTFTGAWIDASNYSCISWTINTNVDSAVNGLRLQFSHDGVNIIRQSAVTFTGVANGVFYSFPVHAKYFRMFYQNGAVAQTTFYLDTQLHEEYNGLAAIPLDTPLNDKSSASTVKAIIAGKGVDGVYVNQRSSGISTLNSSTTPLGPAAVFTGTFEDVVGFSNIAVTIFSNVDSTTDGLIAEFSTDGINVDHQDFYTVPAGIGNQFTFGVAARYFRVRYINGGSAQLTFRLSTLYNLGDIKSSSIRIDDTITGQNDAELVKAVTTGKNPDGDFVNQAMQGYETTNSYTTPLAANGIFRGEWIKWSDLYLNILSVVVSDVAGTLYVEASDEISPVNGSDVSVTHFSTDVYTPSIVPVLRRNTPLQSIWVRHKYVNGPAAQSTFTLVAMFTTADPGLVYKSGNSLPTLTGLVGLVRSIGTVKNAAGTGFQDIPIDPITGDPKTTVQTIRDDILLKPMNNVKVEQGVVSITPVRIDPDPLLNRRKVTISNDGTFNCAIGFDSGITYNSGSFVLKANKERELDLDSSVELWAVAEDAGGVTTPFRRSGSVASGTGTNTSDALTSNDVHASITAAGQTVAVEGFTAGTINPLVSVKMGVEGRKQPGQFETVTFQESQVGATAGAGTVASASLAGGVQQLYVVFVSRNDNVGAVTQVIGGGQSFVAGLQNIVSGNRRIDMWYKYGTFTAGAVTASLANSTNAHIVVHRFTNADPTTPIQTVASATGTGTAVTGPGVAGVINGFALLGVSHTATSGTAGVGYTESSDATNGAGGNTDSLSSERKALVATATETGTYTLASSVPWAAIGVTIAPKPAVDIQITLTYELSAVLGATSGTSNFVSSTVDIEGIIDITGDRSWVVADIPNIKVIVTGLVIGAAAGQVDHIFLDLVDTTGNSTRISVLQTGRSF